MNRVFSYVAIPATDFDRAFAFYHAVTEGLIKRNPQVPFPMAYFVDPSGASVGHLFQLNGFRPSADGAIVYLELARDLNETLARVVKAGGATVMAKTSIGPGRGFWALFLDTEGNKLALHSAE